MKKIFLLIFFVLPLIVISQIIKGTVKDKDGVTISSSNILIKNINDPQSIVEFTNANKGNFSIQLKNEYTSILVEVVATNFGNGTFVIDNPRKNKIYTIDFVIKKNEITLLKEVVVVSEKKITIKKDTIAYNIDKFKDGSERKVQDILKKLPGIEVNENSGEIKYKGKTIETVTLDGDNLFGHNYTLGTKNINIDMVEQVQAIENYSENQLLKGIESADKVSLNLKLKKGKTDNSGNIDLGLGLNSNLNILNNSNINILGISKKYKSFGTLSFNNVGVNNTPFDYFSNSQNIEQLKEKYFHTKSVINELLFTNIIESERVNINNLIFANYNIIFRINKGLSVKTNLYYLKDNLNIKQSISNENRFNTETFSTSDNFQTNKKPNLYRGDLEVKFRTSFNSLLEYSSKFNYEKVDINSNILANHINSYNSNLISKNIFFSQKLIFTNKISKKKAFQVNITHAFNTIPQRLNLKSFNQDNIIEETNNQNSNFKKIYIDGFSNLAGNLSNIKYSFSIGGIYGITPYTSINEINNSNNNLVSDSNIAVYSKKNIYQIGSLNYNINNWTLSPSYAINFLRQSLNEKLISMIVKKNNFLFEPTLLISYKLNPTSLIRSKFSYVKNPITEEYIFRNSVLISNRLKISNIPNLEMQKSTIYGLNYFNNNLYKQYQLNFGLNYKKNKGVFFSDFIVNENETIIKNFFLNEGSNSFSANFMLEKFVSLIETTLKVTSTYTKSNYKNIVNSSNLRDNSSVMLLNELSLKTSFGIKLNFESTFAYNRNTSQSQEFEKIANNSIISNFKVKYKYSRNLFATISNDYYSPNLKIKKNDYLFVDASLIYKPDSKRFEFNLMAKNLLNKKTYSQIQTSDFSKSTFQNNLISRYLFINLTYNL